MLGQAFRKVKPYLLRRRWQIAAAVLALAAELALLIWPIGWSREDLVNELPEEGSYGLAGNYAEDSVCQRFRPKYQNVKSIGIAMKAGEQTVAGGGAVLSVCSDAGEVLYETVLPYERVSFSGYTDVEMNLTLDPSRDYDLYITLGESDNGVLPQVGVCKTECVLPENKSLVFAGQVEDAQLLVRFTYADVIAGGKLLKGILLAVCTAGVLVFSLPDRKWVRSAVGGLVLVLLPRVLGLRLELLTISGAFFSPDAANRNMAIMYLLELILLLCTQSLRAAALISDIALTLLYSVSYYVYTFRGTPLSFNDLSAAGTALQVIGGYRLRPNSHLAFAWAIALFFGLLACRAGGRRKERRKFTRIRFAVRSGSLLAGILVAAVAGYLLLGTDFLMEHGCYPMHNLNPMEGYEFNGYLVASCIDIHGLRLRKPKGYSEQKVEELLSAYQSDDVQEVREELPHIILILNESFSDLRVLGNLKLNEENLGFFYGLQDNAIHGEANVSVVGGSTAISESELLTGISEGLLPNTYYTYQQAISQDTYSLVAALKKYGYKTYSMHPENRANWNRNKVYAYFGFDESLWREDFDIADYCHSGISDAGTYKKVEELYEQREPGERLFIFDVTMQNHGGYSQWGDEFCTVRGENISCHEAAEYLTIIRQSDEAFSELVEYFAKEEEKVIICMAGDHQPRFNEDDFFEDIYAATEGLTREDIAWNRYKTPFVIWANYAIEEKPDRNISLNYLGALLLEAAGIEGSSYFNYLRCLMEEYPVITANGYQDRFGNKRVWSGNGDEFPEYRMLQYHLLNGSEQMK